MIQDEIIGYLRLAAEGRVKLNETDAKLTLDTIADLQSRLAQADEQIRLIHSTRNELIDAALKRAEEQTKLEVTAALKEVVTRLERREKFHRDNRGAAVVVAELDKAIAEILSLTISDNASLYERRMAEGMSDLKIAVVKRLQEREPSSGAWSEQAKIVHEVWKSELRKATTCRATAGKGQAE